MSKNILKIIALFIFGIAGGIFADQILWPYFIERPLFYRYRLDQNPVYVTERKEIIIRENTALENAVEKAEKVVIGVKTKTQEGKILEGSGLIVTSDGLVVTLADLVPQGSNFGFFVDGKAVSYQILKRDLKENLALIKVEAANLSTIGFADFEKIKLGERVFLVGIVFEDEIQKKVANEGIIKSLNENLIETNIAEKVNLSGSPLFDIEGDVLGINNFDSEGNIVSLPAPEIKKFIGI